MAQDIRDMFKNDNTQKELPQDHREEFLKKLNRLKKEDEPKVSFSHLYKIAAALLIFASVGYFAVNNLSSDKTNTVVTAIETQVKEVEKKYLASIDKEWQNFLAVAKDEKLVMRYEKKLEDLSVDYQEIANKFKQDNNNLLIIEALVENLQKRLELLKDIQAHINLLNQKNEQYETTI